MKSSSGQRISGRVAVLVVLALLGVSCQNREAEANDQPMQRAEAELPELATIGGAQDVWPYDFGLDADRQTIQSALGSPDDISDRSVGDDSSPGRVTTWTYSTAEFQFFRSSDGQEEFLLSARISSPDVPLRGGLSVGMPLSEAEALLGKPDVRDNSLLAYFYYDSTIEISVSDGVVESVVLARALP